MKKMNRRVFASRAVQGLAAAALAAACDKRSVSPDVRAPSAPAGLAAQAGDERVTLAWEAHDLTDVTGALSEKAIAGYNIYRDRLFSTQINTQLIQGTRYGDAALENGMAHEYQVSAVDASGNESALSNAVTCTPLLPLTAAVDNGAIRLDWTPDSLIIRDGYDIYRSTNLDTGFVKINSNGLVSGISFRDGSVDDQVRYYYYVVPVQAAIQENRSMLAFAVSGVPSWICTITNSLASSGSNISGPVVEEMLHTAVCQMTGHAAIGQAFESLFPGLTATSIIGVKINCLAGAMLSTHPAVVNAIISGLTSMLNGTFPPYNIIVFDDRMESMIIAAGYTLQNTAGQVRYVTTQDSWSAETYAIKGTNQHLSCMVQQADYLINVPVLKDHNQAGLTFALKNFYGIVSSPGSLHDDKCSPMIAEVYALAASKVKLIVGDAIFAAHRGGPSTMATFAPNTLVIGTDPVATDVEALRIINEQRVATGMALIAMDATGDARHISVAAGQPYVLGDPLLLKVIL